MNIPPAGAIGLVKSKGIIPSAICAYSRHWEHIPEEYLCSHAFLCFENGIIFESTIPKVQMRHISKYKDDEVWILTNPDINEEAIARGRAFCEGSLGKGYDYSGFMHFLIKCIPGAKYLQFCSEYDGDVIRKMYKAILAPSFETGDISPSRINFWCRTNGKYYGWKLWDYWREG